MVEEEEQFLADQYQLALVGQEEDAVARHNSEVMGNFDYLFGSIDG